MGREVPGEENGRGALRAEASASPALRRRLELLHPSVGIAAFPLRDGDAVVLGRGGADVELGWDPQVSRRHVRVERRGDRILVEDLGSKNGVWWRSARVERPLVVGLDDELVVGDTTVRFTIAPDEDPFAEVTSVAAPASPRPSTAPDSSALRAPMVDLRAVTADLRLGLDGRVTAAPLASTAPQAPADQAGSGIAAAAPRPSPAALPPTTTAADTLPPSRGVAGPKTVERDGTLVVDYADTAAFAATYRKEIAVGVLVVPTSARSPVGARVVVELRALGQRLTLPMQLVQVLPPGAIGLAEGGLVLEFVGLDREVLRSLPRLDAPAGLEAIARALARGAGREAAHDLGAAPLQGALEQAKALITAVERGDLYGALQLAADASDDAIAQRLATIEAVLAVGADAPDSPQAARIRAAQERLTRLRAVLTDPMRRLEYDFRAGQLRALDRVQRAKSGTGPTLETLRRVFNAVHPDKVERAAAHTRRAVAASQAGDLDGAIRAARAALDDNPFFDELRAAVADWERSRTRRRG
jgi:pSer/pThr/pTyr-binding forkhead associated (FHA) protein